MGESFGSGVYRRRVVIVQKRKLSACIPTSSPPTVQNSGAISQFELKYDAVKESHVLTSVEPLPLKCTVCVHRGGSRLTNSISRS